MTSEAVSTGIFLKQNPIPSHFAPTVESTITKVITKVLQNLSWPIYLVAYPMQYVAKPFLQRCFSNMQTMTQPVDYVKYKTEKLSTDELSALKNPLKLSNNFSLTNRLVKTGITDGLSDIYGNPTKEMLHVYSLYGQGGYGMIISPDTSVDRRCRLPGTTGHTPVLDNQSNIQAFSELANNMKKNGCAAILQMTHPGPVVPFSDQAYAPTVVRASNPRSGLPQYALQLTHQEVQQIINMFVTSLKQAEKCGFNGIELVATNGYLPVLFLDKYVNKRTDEWKGDLFLIKLVQALLQARTNSKFVVGVKMNASDLQSGGYDSNEAFLLVEKIAGLNVDFIEIGGGNCEQFITNSDSSAVKREEFFCDFANRIFQSSISTPILAVGEWRNVPIMSLAVKKYPHLFIGLGRPAIIDPNIGTKVLSGSISQIPEWFQEYKPSFITPELKKTKEGRRMVHTVEMEWYALGVGTMAFGATIPKVQHIFDNQANERAIKIHRFFRAILPKSFLSPFYRNHPFANK